MTSVPVYHRVLLKISGEAFCQAGSFGIDAAALDAIVQELSPLVRQKVQVGLVIGGGNFLRGRQLGNIQAIQRATADSMGMLATVMNGLALQDAMESSGLPGRVLSAVPTGGMCEPYIRRRAIRHLEKGRVVILAGGTGNPFFTTDTCAALRASELRTDVLMKATKVDGIFEADPLTHPDARKFDRLSYGEVLSRQLGVMDLAAISLCMESKIPVLVFRLGNPGNLSRAVAGEAVGTIISD
jgi:uridylate kinase